MDSNKKAYKLGTVNLECVQGDITDQPDMDAIVNAANAQLMPGGGVAGAIHSKAGPGLAEECAALAPIKTGEAVISRAYDLPNKYVIHTLGPVYGVDRPEKKLLSSCYRSVLNLAETHGVKSVAFPAISTGVFAYPLKEAAQVSLTAIRDFNGYKSLERVRFVLWSETDCKIFRRLMEKLFGKSG